MKKIQNGHHAGTFSPSDPQMKTLNISEPIWQIYFIFGMNVAFHRAIPIHIIKFETNENGRRAGRFSPSTLQMKTLNISEPTRRIYFIFGTNVALHRAINILTLIIEKNPK